jgi:hypothetical protein
MQVDGLADNVAAHAVVADEEVLIVAGIQGRELVTAHLYLEPATAYRLEQSL